MDDRQLMKLMEQHPNAAMEQLIRGYGGLVSAVVRNKLTGAILLSTDVEDCVADVFADFYAERHRFDPEKAAIKTYLCVIARHNAADLLRKRSRQRNDLSLDENPSVGDRPELQPDPEETRLRKEVLTAVENLGEPDRSILLRKYYVGQSSAEIASSLGLTVSNVDSRASRAVEKLRILFGG